MAMLEAREEDSDIVQFFLISSDSGSVLFA